MDETVESLGEFGLIDAVQARLPQGSEVILGPGDDAAVIHAPDRRVVATTDLLVEDQHFRRAWSGAYDVGRKAAAQNLADIVAMGARPTALLVGIAVPPGLDAQWPLGLADGLRDECALVGASVVGGDVVRGEAITVAITALGDLEGRAPVTRSGARPGDVVAVVGRFGWSAAGLALLEHGLEEPAEAVEAYRRPSPPYDLVSPATTAPMTAMIDISDGLLQDLGHVASASAVALDVQTALLPIDGTVTDAAARVGADPLEWVLTGGEDHGFAACFSIAAPAGWQRIGVVREGRGVTVDGVPPRGRTGFDHFRRLES